MLPETDSIDMVLNNTRAEKRNFHIERLLIQKI